MQRAAQQIIGREGETATFLKRSFFNLELRVVGFAPRQFNRYVAGRSMGQQPKDNLFDNGALETLDSSMNYHLGGRFSSEEQNLYPGINEYQCDRAYRYIQTRV